MEPEMKFEIYQTSDIYFSAYLLAIDIPLLSTEKQPDPKNETREKTVFVFKMPKNQFNNIKNGFFGGSADVKAQKFVNSLKMLKSMCFVV